MLTICQFLNAQYTPAYRIVSYHNARFISLMPDFL